MSLTEEGKSGLGKLAKLRRWMGKERAVNPVFYLFLGWLGLGAVILALVISFAVNAIHEGGKAHDAGEVIQQPELSNQTRRQQDRDSSQVSSERPATTPRYQARQGASVEGRTPLSEWLRLDAVAKYNRAVQMIAVLYPNIDPNLGARRATELQRCIDTVARDPVSVANTSIEMTAATCAAQMWGI